jgi:hypothetical protein
VPAEKNRASVREGIKALFGVRRGFDKVEEEAGLSWQQEQLDYCTRPPALAGTP